MSLSCASLLAILGAMLDKQATSRSWSLFFKVYMLYASIYVSIQVFYSSFRVSNMLVQTPLRSGSWLRWIYSVMYFCKLMLDYVILNLDSVTRFMMVLHDKRSDIGSSQEGKRKYSWVNRETWSFQSCCDELFI